MKNDRLIRLEEVLSYIPLGKTNFLSLTTKIDLLKPSKIGRTNVWKLSKIQEYIDLVDQKDAV